MDRLCGYGPHNERSNRSGSAVAVAERSCSGLWNRHTRVRIPSATVTHIERAGLPNKVIKTRVLCIIFTYSGLLRKVGGLFFNVTI